MSQNIRVFGLIASALIALVATYVCMIYNIELVNSSISSVSKTMILLTVLIMPIAILASYNNIVHSYTTYIALLLGLELILVYLFSTNDIVLFYVLFELVLLPLYMLLGSYGASTERLRASLLLWTYTFIGSICLLLSIIWLLTMLGSSDLSIMSNYALQLADSSIAWILIAIGIANKIPSVPIHIWLPRAHVQANISTSILLAAVILKLSTYATVLLLIHMLPSSAAYYATLWLVLALISYIHSALATISQIDSKVLIAYSSVAHMSIITIGLHSNSYIGIIGAILLAIAHASSSSALFLIFGQVIYDRLHTRTLYYIRNIVAYAPSLRTILFLAIFVNSATPMSINWLAELYVLIGISYSNLAITFLLGTTIITTALYSFWMYSYMSGNIGNYILYDMTKLELSTLLYILVPNIVLGLSVWLIEPVLMHSAISLLY